MQRDPLAGDHRDGFYWPEMSVLDLDPVASLALATAVLAAALLYSSVGHAGASGYLAAMAFFGIAPATMRPTALVLNVLVASLTAGRFVGARAVPWGLLWPFCLGSIPAAWIGGSITPPGSLHRPLLGACLLAAAVRTGLPAGRVGAWPAPGRIASTAMGAGLGLISGLTGIGGGVFLSPLLLLTGWADPRTTAGASSVFILANSAAGLIGLLGAGSVVLPPGTLTLAVIAAVGGSIGSWLGARRLPSSSLRRLLAVVLVVAGLKLLLT